MAGTRVANRYAKSLLTLAIEQGELEVAYSDMQTSAASCNGSKELSSFLKSPIIKADKKLSILKELFGKTLSKLSIEFINIITKKKREVHLEAIAEEFVKQYRKHKKILSAVITSARGIDDVVRAKVLEVVKSEKQSEVELVEKVDDSLIGGFVLTIGDKQVDASIARRLQRLEMSFSENPYIKDY